MNYNHNTYHSNRTAGRSTIAKYLSQRLAMPGALSTTELGRRIGYERRDMIPMFMSGKAKVPLRVLLLLAQELDVPLVPLFLMALEQFEGDELVAALSHFFDARAKRYPSRRQDGSALQHARFRARPKATNLVTAVLSRAASSVMSALAVVVMAAYDELQTKRMTPEMTPQLRDRRSFQGALIRSDLGRGGQIASSTG